MTGVHTAAASQLVLPSRTLFAATRLRDGTDAVLSVQMSLDAGSAVPSRIELRAVRADAPERQRLMLMEPAELLGGGGLLRCVVDLRTTLTSYPFDQPSARIATIEVLQVAGAAPRERMQTAATGVVDWALDELEHLLLLATYIELRGTAAAIDDVGRNDDSTWDERMAGGDFGRWAADLLSARGFRVDRADPGTYARLLNPYMQSRLGGGDHV